MRSSRDPENQGLTPSGSKKAGLFIRPNSAEPNAAPNPAIEASKGPASAPSSPAPSPAPEAFASEAVNAILTAQGLPTTYRKPKLVSAQKGVIVSQGAVVTPTNEPAAQAKSSFVLYSFATYNATAEAAATFAVPVFNGFNSRHAFYMQILGLNPNSITNGGEIIFEVKTDGSMEVAFWTDKTGTFFETMFLNRLKIQGIDTSTLDTIKDTAEKAQAAKAKAIAEIPNYYQTLPADKYVSVAAWEDTLCSKHLGAALFFEQKNASPIYQLRETIGELDLSQLSAEALAFATALLYKIDEERAANLCFASLSP